MSEKPSPQPESGPSPIGEISQEPSAFESFLDANQKKLIIVGILAIIALIAFVIIAGLQKLAAQNAANDVAAARSIPELESVSKKYQGSNAGGSALIFKSQLLWRDQQGQEAIQSLEEFISSYPEHPAIGNAYASLGSYQQQMGKSEEAETAFQKAAELSDSSASSLALLSLGDLARSAGKDDEAKNLYNRVINEYEDRHFQVKFMARDRLKLIGVDPPSEKTDEPSGTLPQPSVSSAPITLPPPSGDSQNGLEELPDLELPEKNHSPEETEEQAPSPAQ